MPNEGDTKKRYRTLGQLVGNQRYSKGQLIDTDEHESDELAMMEAAGELDFIDTVVFDQTADKGRGGWVAQPEESEAPEESGSDVDTPPEGIVEAAQEEVSADPGA